MPPIELDLAKWLWHRLCEIDRGHAAMTSNIFLEIQYTVMMVYMKSAQDNRISRFLQMEHSKREGVSLRSMEQRQ